jgi:DNA-binding transcriptional ArsR family regulator
MLAVPSTCAPCSTHSSSDQEAKPQERGCVSTSTASRLAHERRAGAGNAYELRKSGARQVEIARQMYDEVDENSRRRCTVAEIAGEFGVSRPTIYQHLDPTATR